jgi:hypothetical protein
MGPDPGFNVKTVIHDIKCANLSDGQSAVFFRNLRFIKWPVKLIKCVMRRLVYET